MGVCGGVCDTREAGCRKIVLRSVCMYVCVILGKPGVGKLFLDLYVCVILGKPGA